MMPIDLLTTATGSLLPFDPAASKAPVANDAKPEGRPQPRPNPSQSDALDINGRSLPRRPEQVFAAVAQLAERVEAAGPAELRALHAQLKSTALQPESPASFAPALARVVEGETGAPRPAPQAAWMQEMTRLAESLEASTHPAPAQDAVKVLIRQAVRMLQEHAATTETQRQPVPAKFTTTTNAAPENTDGLDMASQTYTLPRAPLAPSSGTFQPAVGLPAETPNTAGRPEAKPQQPVPGTDAGVEQLPATFPRPVIAGTQVPEQGAALAASADPSKTLQAGAGGETATPAPMAERSSKTEAPGSPQLAVESGVAPFQGDQPGRSSGSAPETRATDHREIASQPAQRMAAEPLSATPRTEVAGRTNTAEATGALPGLPGAAASTVRALEGQATEPGMRLTQTAQWTGLIPLDIGGKLTPAWLTMEWTPPEQARDESGSGKVEKAAARPVSVALDLASEELGRISIRMSWFQGELAGALLAERPEILELAGRELGSLESRLGRLDQGQVSFRVGPLAESA